MVFLAGRRPAENFGDSPPQANFFRVIYHLYREKMLGKHGFSNVSGERRAAGEKTLKLIVYRCLSRAIAGFRLLI